MIDIKELIYSYLTENDMISQSENSENAYVTLEIKGGEIIIKGNALGLVQLAEYMVSIALKSFNGAHIHLDENNFFDKINGELIIVKHSNELE